MGNFPNRRDGSTITQEWFRRFIFISAGGLDVPTSGGASHTQYTGTDAVLPAKAFSNTSEKVAYFHFPVPEGFDGDRIRWQIRWTAIAGTIGGSTTFSLKIRTPADGEAISGSYVDVGDAMDIYVGPGRIHWTPILEQTANLPEANEHVIGKISRKVSSSQRVGADILVLGIQLEFAT